MVPTLLANPTALSEILFACDLLLDTHTQVLLGIPREAEREAPVPLLSVFRSGFVPNRILSVFREKEEQV